MFLAKAINQSMVDLDLGTGALVAILGYLVVFFGLVLLMAVIWVVGKIMVAARKQPAAAAEAPAAPVVVTEPAPGTAGEIKLYNVSDRDAALIMAIVANKLHKPLNELRFKSIKEVK